MEKLQPQLEGAEKTNPVLQLEDVSHLSTVLFIESEISEWISEFTLVNRNLHSQFFSFHKKAILCWCVSVVSEADKANVDISIAENTTDY